MKREAGKHFTIRIEADLWPRIVGIVQDVSTRCQVEADLRRAASVFESTSEAVAILDAERRVDCVNAAFTVVTGYAGAEVLEQQCRDGAWCKYRQNA